MSAQTKSASMDNAVTEKIVNIHMMIVFGVCIVFGAVNLISGAVLIAIVTLLMGIAVPTAVFFIKKRASLILCGTILSQVQLLTIILISTAKHELHYMFPLILASMAIAAIYYNQRNLIIHWVVMDIACLTGILFRPVFYAGADIGLLIKGIIGINTGGGTDLLSHKMYAGIYRGLTPRKRRNEEAPGAGKRANAELRKADGASK